MNSREWLDRAKNKIADLSVGTRFEVKELFEEVDWRALSRGERITFGKVFANEVREGNIPNVCPMERGKNNHSKYEKQGE